MDAVARSEPCGMVRKIVHSRPAPHENQMQIRVRFRQRIEGRHQIAVPFPQAQDGNLGDEYCGFGQSQVSEHLSPGLRPVGNRRIRHTRRDAADKAIRQREIPFQLVGDRVGRRYDGRGELPVDQVIPRGYLHRNADVTVAHPPFDAGSSRSGKRHPCIDIGMRTHQFRLQLPEQLVTTEEVPGLGGFLELHGDHLEALRFECLGNFRFVARHQDAPETLVPEPLAFRQGADLLPAPSQGGFGMDENGCFGRHAFLGSRH